MAREHTIKGPACTPSCWSGPCRPAIWPTTPAGRSWPTRPPSTAWGGPGRARGPLRRAGRRLPGRLGHPKDLERGGRRGLRLGAGALLQLAAEAQRSAGLSARVRDLLDGQAVVEQAKGALMARRGIDAEAAAEQLEQLARRSGRPLEDVAAGLLRRLGAGGR